MIGTLPQYALELSIANNFGVGFEHGPQRAKHFVTDCNCAAAVGDFGAAEWPREIASLRTLGQPQLRFRPTHLQLRFMWPLLRLSTLRNGEKKALCLTIQVSYAVTSTRLGCGP